MNLFNCCKNCTDRHAKCHSTCERYLKDRARLDEINAVRNVQVECRSYVIEGVIKNKKRNLRRKKGRINSDG